MNFLQTEHGGPDGGPPVAHDFSTNASPLGPPPALWQAVQLADRQAYPDPHYGALRRRLGEAHATHHELVLPTAGGAEGIRRLTLAAMLAGRREVWVPQPGFGDYAAAAHALGLGLAVKPYADSADIRPTAPALVWICEPCNPTGASAAAWPDLGDHLVAVDRAYEPLRLHGSAPALPPEVWQLICPNKALGLTGVRAGYLVAPAADTVWSRAQSLAPSWVLSAEGVAMLRHWRDDATAAWLADARAQLREWTAHQRALLAEMHWQQRPSCTNFWLARPPRHDIATRLHEWGVRLRDATSFGLPGWVRVSAQPPAAQQALQLALLEIESEDS